MLSGIFYIKYIPLLLFIGLDFNSALGQTPVKKYERDTDLSACYNTSFYKILHNIRPIGRWRRFILVFWDNNDTVLKYTRNPVDLKKNKLIYGFEIHAFPQKGQLPGMCSDMRFANDLIPHIFKIKSGELTLTQITDPDAGEYYDMIFTNCVFKDFWGNKIYLDRQEILVKAHLPGTG